jgi:hypothetical protein
MKIKNSTLNGKVFSRLLQYRIFYLENYYLDYIKIGTEDL